MKYNYEVSVNENRAKLNKDIFLFRGNRNIHYYFSIKGARFAFKKEGDLIENANAIYAAVTVIKPNGVEVANAIAPVENGLIHLKVTEDLIDEEVEVGDFDLVFDLFDDTDGAVTIPKVIGQFHVLERPCTTPISELAVATNTTNEVDYALTDYAITTYAEPVASTNEDGTFAKKTWVAKEKITTAELNRMEEGISDVSSQCKDIAKQVGTETLNTTAQDLKGAINEVFQLVAKILGSTVKINSLSKLSDCKFKLISSTSNASYNSTTEAGKNYNDDSWDNISIPHDWSIYNSFNSNSPSGYEGGYLDGGDAWYRFKLKTAKLEGQKVYIYFDGIYMESDVYINGTKVKSNKWYNPFYVEITDYVQYNNNDTLAVFVRNQQPSSRWYSGSGIIRNAYLVSANDVEIGINDINITTPTLETDVKTNIANTKIDIKINSTTVKTINLINEIYFNNSLVESNTKEVALSIGDNSISEYIQINNPSLWDEYNGNLYTLKTYIKIGVETYYSTETKYGYRYFKFDKDTGFWLNGKNLKLRGVCMHHDLGCLGAEVNKSAIERQIDLLIDMGVNAIRITHNPGSSEFLNVCAKRVF